MQVKQTGSLNSANDRHDGRCRPLSVLQPDFGRRGRGAPGYEACLNRDCNIDEFNIIKAFQGSAYPFTTDPGGCPDECS